MQGYESIFILDPDTTQEQQDGLVDKFKGLVDTNGGQLVHHAMWGRRKLAYEVKKRQYGIYHLFYLDRTPPALKALEDQFRLEDNVLKWMTVSVEDVEKEREGFERLKAQGTIAQQLSE